MARKATTGINGVVGTAFTLDAEATFGSAMAAAVPPFHSVAGDVDPQVAFGSAMAAPPSARQRFR